MNELDTSFFIGEQFVGVSGGSRKRKATSQKSPKFIKTAGQRSGKWTEVEENFANQLVVDFERGFLDDCERGMTLRSYLARTLNCDPMRISKKFAGRCIGKLAYENCHSSSLSEKMKSPLSRLRAIYLAASIEDTRDQHMKQGSHRNIGSNDDYSFSYTDNEEELGSEEDSGDDSANGNIDTSVVSDEHTNKPLVYTGSVLDLIDFVSGSEIEGMYAFSSEGGDCLVANGADDEWQHWQRYGVPGLLGKSENSMDLHSAETVNRTDFVRSEPSPTGITDGPAVIELENTTVPNLL